MSAQPFDAMYPAPRHWSIVTDIRLPAGKFTPGPSTGNETQYCPESAHRLIWITILATVCYPIAELIADDQAKPKWGVTVNVDIYIGSVGYVERIYPTALFDVVYVDIVYLRRTVIGTHQHDIGATTPGGWSSKCSQRDIGRADPEWRLYA